MYKNFDLYQKSKSKFLSIMTTVILTDCPYLIRYELLYIT